MSTATFNQSIGTSDESQAAIIRRFAWKETRMLRGLWLAVLVMGVFVQWVMNEFTPPAFDQAMQLFCVALCAAVLYAIGAAATIFSVEHEDETYSFLAGLPATWWPVFAGKVAVVFTSAVALAASLSVIGWMISGFDIPSAKDATAAFGLFGVAMLEGIAWGTFFSMLVKRPLVAAMLTIVVGAVAVNVIVNSTSSYAVASTNPDAYREVLPMRLAVAAIVLVASAVVARGWLVTGTAAMGAHAGSPSLWKLLRSRGAIRLLPSSAAAHRTARRTMLARLVWQTWRDAGKLLLVPLGLAFVMLLGIRMISIMVSVVYDFEYLTPAALLCTAFFAPALYGALAFSADQRRESYRFLSEHAGRPRYVWLARHVVWLGSLALVSLAFFLLASVLTFVTMRQAGVRFTEGFVRQGHTPPEMDYGFIEFTRIAVQGSTFAALGILTAYSVGQLCSMLLRSGILAVFLSLLLSVFLSLWIAVLFVWQLNGLLFLLPLAMGFMLATWLRAPDWIAGRNTWRSWGKPALAVAVSISFVAVALPAARLQQIRSGQIGAPLVSERSALDAPQSRETADMYREAVELLRSRPNVNLLHRWTKPEFMEDGSSGRVGGIDETKIPLDQLAEYRAAVQAQNAYRCDAQAAAIKLAIEASARPFCYFDFDVAQVSWPSRGRRYYEFTELLNALLSIEPAEPFDRLLAALRMSAHLAAGQPSVIWKDQTERERKVLQKIAEWAAHDGRTRDELKSALTQLTEHFRSRQPGILQESLYADHRFVRDVLAGRQPPLVLNTEEDWLAWQLALMAHELSWERERGFVALDAITQRNASDASELVDMIRNSYQRDHGYTLLRKWLRPRGIRYSAWPENWRLALPAASTSYLTRFEFAARTDVHELYRAYCDSEACRRAAQLQVALAMFRLDHGEDPKWLSELVPEYLDALPLDPYCGQPFQYAAGGLDRPLVSRLNDGTYQEIAPSTPLLWSVGPANARLKQQERRVLQPTLDDPARTENETTDLVFILNALEDGWWGEPALVFPLAD